MEIKRNVSIQAQLPIYGVLKNQPITGYVRSIHLTTEQIRKCIVQKARVTEISENGQRTLLTLANYNKIEPIEVPKTPIEDSVEQEKKMETEESVEKTDNTTEETDDVETTTDVENEVETEEVVEETEDTIEESDDIESTTDVENEVETNTETYVPRHNNGKKSKNRK